MLSIKLNVFLEFSCFFYDPMNVSSLFSGSSAFSKSSLYIWKFSVHMLKPCLSVYSITWLACGMSTTMPYFQHSFSLSFIGIGRETDLFQSWSHGWVFQICWHIECSTLTVPSFRIWNSITGVPLSPLALFIVMLPKAHLTLYSRMSDSRWPSWLSGSWRSFLYSSSVHSFQLFWISSAFVSSYHFCPLLNPSLHEIFPWYL